MEINLYCLIYLVQKRGIIVPIPPMDSNFLPTGLHDCTIDEIYQYFGTNERRNLLIENLHTYTQKVKDFGIEGWIIIDGSFVTAKELPGDIDIVLVVSENYDLMAPITPIERKILSQEYVKDNFELHLFVAFDGETANHWKSFFSRIRGMEHFKKGLLRMAI